MKKSAFIFGVMILFSITGCSSQFQRVDVITDGVTRTFYVETVSKENEMKQGLMYRKTLSQNAGMFFVFPDEAQRIFWMKNTRISLSIIFIDANYQIISIEDAVPCVAPPCPTYSSKGPAKYVLEINKGIIRMDASGQIRIGEFES